MAPSREERERAARAGFDAFNTGDQRAVADLLAEDVVVFASPELANAGRFEGRDGYLRWVEPWIDAWQDLGMEIEKLTAVGDRHVLAEVHQTGHGRAGIEVSMNVAFLFEIRNDGEVAYLALHPDRGSALADAETREMAEQREARG
jgi:ketosteroid isomerase-like protein